MIELYAKGTTDFTKHGIALAATQASVTWQDNGRFDMDMTMPFNPNITIDYGMILRSPVPVQEVGSITLGTVSYWQIASGQTDVPLYSRIPTLQNVSYQQWCANRVEKIYEIGDKVTYLKQNYQMIALDPGSEMNYNHTPDNYPQYWEEISNTIGKPGKIAAELDAGDQITKIGNYNNTYMRAADTAGHVGFIQISKCTDMSESGTRTVPAQHIEKQSFTIKEITKSSDGKTLTVHAEHISYQLGRTMLGECNISRANPATALMFIKGAMKESYPGEVETNLTDNDALITGDFSWKNAQAAILDPKSGLLQATNGRIIRNDYNVYIIRDTEDDPQYRITYGTNMKAVKWDGNVDEQVTRVYPLAQNEDGSTLLLPEEYIDTVRAIPYIRPEALNTGLKVGEKEEQEDGTEVELDEATVISRMREAANNRFTIDECDKPVITLDVDWQHLPDTEEYKEYAALANAAPGERVEVKNTPMGISDVIRMTGYTYDPILLRYKKGSFGKKKTSPGVASYDIQTGAVTGRALASGAVTSGNIQAGSITAREIEANSITSDKIASKSIITEQLAANAVTADEISAGAVTAAKIGAGQITADHIDTNEINAIDAKLGVADIANAQIANADIGFAQVKALTAESLIARDAVTDRYFIDKLQVRNAQFVYATVGELIVKASDNHYYRLDVDQYGVLTPTDVTSSLSAGEITAGMTSDGHSTIIETDLAVTDLSAANAKAINALIDQLTASRIDVDELFARQAFIGKLTTTDISSNTYLRTMVTDLAYGIQSGIAITGNGIEVSGAKYVKIKSGGSFSVDSGNFAIDTSGNVTMSGTITAGAGSTIGGWTMGANRMSSGSGSGYVAMDSASNGTYAIWAGNETSSSAPFRVKRDGTVTLTKLLALGEDGTETEVNLRTAGLWKLSSVNVKDASVSGSTLTITRFSGGNVVVNFSSAASVILSGSWSGSTFTVTDAGTGTALSETLSYNKVAYALNSPTTTVDTFSSTGMACVYVTAQSLGGGNGRLYTFNVDASAAYSQGQDSVDVTNGAWTTRSAGESGRASITFSPSAGSGASKDLQITLRKGTGTPTDGTQTVSAAASIDGSALVDVKTLLFSMTAGSWSSNKTTVTMKADATTLCTLEVDAGSVYTAGESAGQATGWALAVSKVVLPSSSTASSMSVVTPGNTYNTDGANTYVVSADNNYAYIKISGTNTTVARASHSAFSNGASSVTLSGAWSGNTYTVTASNTKTNAITMSGSKGTGTNANATFTVNSFNSSHKAYFLVSCAPFYMGCNIDASGQYTSGQNSVTLSQGGWSSGSNIVTASNGKTSVVATPTISSCVLNGVSSGTTYNINVSMGGTVRASTVNCSAAYNKGWNDCLDACGFGNYTKFYVGGSYARYAYSAPTSGADRYDYCRYGAEMATGHDVPARK